MSVIDEKGKLGGKINIIDLLVILVILAAVLAVFVLGGKMPGNTDAAPEHVIYKVKVLGVDEDVYKSIQTQIPSQLVGDDQLQDGYVTSVEGVKVEESDETLIQANRNVYYATIRPGLAGTYDLVFTIEANIYDPVTSKIGTQEVRTGLSHVVKTTSFALDNGVIISREVVPPEG